MTQKEIYISTDIESDGPIPGVNSMLSLASAAFSADKSLLGCFSTNLNTLPGAVADDSTMQWWSRHPKAWQACREDCQDPETAMLRYSNWIKALPGKPVFVAYPAGFDFMFVYWYLIRFTGSSPFSHSALDIKSFAMAMLKKPYRESAKRNMPDHWFDESAHTHIALDDAIEQGRLFCNMLQDNLNKK